MRKEKFIRNWEKKRTAGSLKYVLKLGLFISLGSSATLWVVTSVQLVDRKEIALLEAFDLALRHFYLNQLMRGKIGESLCAAFTSIFFDALGLYLHSKLC